jgi:hypothetical protein
MIIREFKDLTEKETGNYKILVLSSLLGEYTANDMFNAHQCGLLFSLLLNKT